MKTLISVSVYIQVVQVAAVKLTDLQGKIVSCVVHSTSVPMKEERSHHYLILNSLIKRSYSKQTW